MFMRSRCFNPAVLAAVALAFICFLLCYTKGSSNSITLFQLWTQAYRYARDDVTIIYDQSGISAALPQYRQGLLDFLATDRGIAESGLTDESNYVNLIQFPLAGQAMVIAYHLPALNATDPPLILNRTVLADIWSGAISMWNDVAIIELNPELAGKLPMASIQLGYVDGTNKLAVSEIFKSALESFSPSFREQFAAVNRSFARMPPALAGRAKPVSTLSVTRASWLANNTNAMTVVNYNDIVGRFPAARMYNKAGNLVEPTIAAVQSAMSDSQNDYNLGRFTAEIIDANGTNSWPLAYLTFFAMDRNGTSIDCTNQQELLNFVAWIHTNDEASAVVTNANFAPLDVGLRKKLIELLNNVRCNGEQAFNTAVLVAAGAQISILESWASSWATDDARLEYYRTNSEAGKQQLANNNIDFALSGNALGDQWARVIGDDVSVLPLAALPLVPTYNIPELLGLHDLVLNADVIARIYLNQITMWNDTRIKDINKPAVAALLPARPIIVVLENITAVQFLWSSWLSSATATWTLGAGGDLVLPIEGSSDRSLRSLTGGEELLSIMIARPYTFSFWTIYDVRRTRVLGISSLINSAGKEVRPSLGSVKSAIEDFAAAQTALSAVSLMNGPGNDSWPLAIFTSAIYHSRTMQNCDDARAMADFFRWTLLEPKSEVLASRQGYVIAARSSSLLRDFYNQLKGFTCNGSPVSALAGCILDGELCSSQGTCDGGRCSCYAGRSGSYCETDSSSSSLSGEEGIIIATIVPSVVVLSVLICVLIAAFITVTVYRLRRAGDDDWEIKYEELEIGEHLGTGGFGQVHKATWKGTEVAVKVMVPERITKEMERAFKEEVQVMTALRHPNVVLFMAASTKAPKMCIVMEYMSLGSLHELLLNDLIVSIPFALKAKMAYQASKGMHFLHSSGIVHRDLKSLNLLLDAKWNVKVSDFGLTKFRADISSGKTRNNQHHQNYSTAAAASVHWTAPEVLNETADVDLILADVYSFGIVLWELLTRKQPYSGLSPSAVAVSVIRDAMRPELPAQDECPRPTEYDELVTSCWHQDPIIRPTFLEIMTRLSTMHGDSTSAVGHTSRTSSSSGGGGAAAGTVGHGNTKTSAYSLGTPSSAGSSASSSSSSQASLRHTTAGAGCEVQRPPTGEVTIAFSDVTRAASLWEFNAGAMRDATQLHNRTLRAALERHHGYEVMSLRDRNSGEGSFCVA